MKMLDGKAAKGFVLILCLCFTGCAASAPAVSESVSVTGAATALKRLTTGRANEYVSDISPDNKWLLVDLEASGQERQKIGIEKYDVDAGVKVLLTPQTSNNKEGKWVHNRMNEVTGFVFVSDRLGVTTLVRSLGTTGESGVKFITQPALGPVRYPDVSPNQKDVVFSIMKSESDSQLSVVAMDGRNIRMYGAGYQADWSPDGKTVLFVRLVGQYRRVYRMDISTGSNLIELSEYQANDIMPTWSPDGTHIAFLSDRIGSRYHLFIMTRNGKDITQLTDGDFDVGSLCWAKDGFIYFSANAGNNWDMWRLKPQL